VTAAWYLLTVVLGGIGAVALFRAIERLVFGGGTGSPWVQVLVGLLALAGAWKSFQKARGRESAP
jgi:hypothetical protein